MSKSVDCAVTRDRFCVRSIRRLTDFQRRETRPWRTRSPRSPMGHAVCEFPRLNAGAYAISVFHDENSNGRLDTNLMGIPREGVGASNNAKGHFGPPKFDAAAFRFSGSRLEVKITVNYL